MYIYSLSSFHFISFLMLKHSHREMKMKECNRDGYSECCCIHPTHTVVGVCAFCLNDRLLVLAANSHQTRRLHENKNIHTFYDMFSVKGLQHRIEVKKKKSDDQNLIITPSVCSQEDSFISIKFGDNGVASWEKGNISKAAAAAALDHQIEYDNCNDARNIISVVDHAQHRAAMLRWRRRIGHILHLVRWKRSSKGNMCHGAKLEGANFRYGWMRNLTKNRGLFG